MRPFHRELRPRQAAVAAPAANPVARHSQIDALEAGKASVASVQAAAAVIQAGLAAIDLRLIPTESSVADFDDPTRLPEATDVRNGDLVVIYRDGVKMRTTMAAAKVFFLG